MRIVVLAGGISPERDISLVTGRAVEDALQQLGHTTCLVDPDRDFPEKLCHLRRDGWEFVWIALHGSHGENGSVQTLLDWVGLPYQGSGYLASALAMDKVISKQLFQAAGLSTPASQAVRRGQSIQWSEAVAGLGSPVVIKPSDCGSSIGVTIVETERAFKQGLQSSFQVSETTLLESFVTGKELTISILGDLVMPAIEIVPIQGGFYDYRAKYGAQGSRHLIPCSLSAQGLVKAEALAVQAYQVLHCRGLARVDLRIDQQEEPWLLEVNTLPGMTPTSLCPDAASALGWTFPQLVQRILDCGLATVKATAARD